MDINTLRGLSSVLVLIAFIGICWWAFSPKRRKRFDEAANLPFADEPNAEDHKDSQDAPQASTPSASEAKNTVSKEDAGPSDKKQDQL